MLCVLVCSVCLCVIFLMCCVMLYGMFLLSVCVDACVLFLACVHFVCDLLCDGLWLVVCVVLCVCVRMCLVGLGV